MIESGFDMPEPTEQYVRSLRNYVFESPTSDTNWEYCGPNWMKPDAFNWLVVEAAIIEARANRKKYG